MGSWRPDDTSPSASALLDRQGGLLKMPLSARMRGFLSRLRAIHDVCCSISFNANI